MVDRFNRFSAAIFEISRCWHKIAGEEMAKYGLKGPYVVYLMALLRCADGLTAAQICELTGRDKADVSRAMSVLEVNGLVCKQGENTYRVQLALTALGIAAAEQVSQRAAVAVELAGKDISDEERAIFYSALESIARNLQILSKGGLPPKGE